MKSPCFIKTVLPFLFRDDKKTTDAKIKNHLEITHRANKALDKAIAALDGETGWWTCRCDEKEKECEYGSNHKSA